MRWKPKPKPKSETKIIWSPKSGKVKKFQQNYLKVRVKVKTLTPSARGMWASSSKSVIAELKSRAQSGKLTMRARASDHTMLD